MGLDTELEFEKYCSIGQSPKIGPRSHSHGSKVEKRDVKRKPMSGSHLVRQMDQDSTEITFGNSRSLSCKSVPSGAAEYGSNGEMKRGSIYQSSKTVRKIKKMGELEGRRKIELSRSSDTSLSFRIFDTLSESNDYIPPMQQKRSPLMPLMTDMETAISKTYKEPDSQDFFDLSFRVPSSTCNIAHEDVSADGFFEICLDPEDRKPCPAETIGRGLLGEVSFRCNQTIGPLNNSNDFLERETVHTLNKSSSEKVGMPYLPCLSESDPSKASPKGRFSPIRRMLDPIMKSKSQRSPSVSIAEFGDLTTMTLPNMRRNRTLCKSLLQDFSNTVVKEQSSAQFSNKDQQSSVVSTSPAHLHGFLKLEYKHGAPFFKFFVRDFEDVLTAKTWKANNAFNWVYTFHSTNSRKKNNNSGWGTKERHKEASVVGQMQVSCYLCSEIRSGGAFDYSMVTEFVLYDIGHARKSLAAEQSSPCSPDSIKPINGTSGEALIKGPSMDPNDVSDLENHKLQPRHASGGDVSDASTSCPWSPADLHPNLEIAAIVIQVPFEKRESLKDKQEVCSKAYSDLFESSMVEQRNDDKQSSTSPANVKVVTVTGTHGLPSTDDGCGPSPLLDRWRSGGHCDCGGWDMACPLFVFSNPTTGNVGDNPSTENVELVELFVQGVKEKMPALTITAIDEGQYSVDFHAQLSSLQAFSICVAILHSAEVSTVIGQERTRQRLHNDSLKVLLEEEVRFLIEAVAGEEKRKATKRMEETPPCFILNPPFSPIARV
ncbi:PREDICTED: uncharacterized protein LOC104596069 [Nelumbo nucifera]|uniref:Uncharacterized protein LOC104596069 n=2 Tax=Nelumbo nucifera TaxID=4432 RepID=A0A1U8A2J8_NELNU|nr:PREDICTED: uncharacterized protein LOC104596069 [Nelumbo nucifera]XP_010255388.1 PREDICTED: uncharacterized protein LOC104596069 [Nelumbo nucifera]DAD18914.1 TPA_asm: hypothetical protein HUJ06_020377 [Nelumbo nucifera]